MREIARFCIVRLLLQNASANAACNDDQALFAACAASGKVGSCWLQGIVLCGKHSQLWQSG